MKKTIAIIAGLIVFFSALTVNIIKHKPLNEEQYKILEEVVYEAYTNTDVLIEVPDGVHLTKSESRITADFSTHPTYIYYGSVEGKLANNEFIVTRVDETVDTIFNIIIISFTITILSVILICIFLLVLGMALIIASDDEDEPFINFCGVKNIKHVFKHIKEWFNFKKLLAILIVMIIFIGNFAFYMHITRPFDEDKWEQAETIAENVYNSNSELIEIPENFDISMNAYKIVVSSSDDLTMSISTLIAKVKDGNLVFTRNNEIADQILVSLVCSLLTAFIALVIILLIFVFCEEVLKPKTAKLKKNFKEKRSLKKAEKIKRKTKKNRLK